MSSTLLPTGRVLLARPELVPTRVTSRNSRAELEELLLLLKCRLRIRLKNQEIWLIGVDLGMTRELPQPFSKDREENKPQNRWANC